MIEEARNVLSQTRNQIRQQLNDFDGDMEQDDEGEDAPLRVKNQSIIYIYKMFLAQEKALYQNLNTMKRQNQTYIGFFWAPVENEQFIREKIESEDSGTKVQPYDNHNIARPTYFKPNEFSYVFQEITDTYGVPSYQEANPTVISMVTFPFLFGLMFGDFGHGSLIFFFGSFLVLFNNYLKGGLVDMLLPYRYFFMLLGLMASYCGIIYNEFFALPMNIFESCYTLDSKQMWDPTQNEEG
jgi:V-type H+-transporting ATPase subunit a